MSCPPGPALRRALLAISPIAGETCVSHGPSRRSLWGHSWPTFMSRGLIASATGRTTSTSRETVPCKARHLSCDTQVTWTTAAMSQLVPKGAPAFPGTARESYSFIPLTMSLDKIDQNGTPGASLCTSSQTRHKFAYRGGASMCSC